MNINADINNASVPVSVIVSRGQTNKRSGHARLYQLLAHVQKAGSCDLIFKQAGTRQRDF